MGEGRWAVLIDENLRSTNLSNANLADADLRNANLSQASLYRADMTYEEVWRTNLKGCRIDPAVLHRILGCDMH